MENAEADREGQAFFRKARWVIIPLGLVMTAGTMALFAVGSSLAFAAFLAGIVFVAGWNLFVVLKLRRLREKHQDGLRNAGGAVGPEIGKPHAVERSVLSRLLLGLRSIGWSTPVQASSSAPPPVVHEQLAGLAELEGAPFTWQQVPDGVAVGWKLHPSGIRNRIFMIGEGVLRQDVNGTNFTGSIRPDAMTRLSMLHMAVFGAGGVVAIAIGIGGLLVGSGARGPFVFALLWGSFGTIFTASWSWSNAKTYELHEQILRTVFGESLNIGSPH